MESENRYNTPGRYFLPPTISYYVDGAGRRDVIDVSICDCDACLQKRVQLIHLCPDRIWEQILSKCSLDGQFEVT